MDTSVDTIPRFRIRPAEGLDPLEWLAAQPAGERRYFASRDGKFEIAGVGGALRVRATTADEVDAAWRRMARICESASGRPVCWLGGQAFDPAAPGDELWSDFPALDFAVPEQMVRREGDSVTMATCTSVSRGDATSEPPTAPPAAPLKRSDLPAREAWLTGVAKTLAAIDRSEVEKVVLSRRSTFSFDHPVDPGACLAALPGRDCYRFLVEPTAGSAFIGLTPERLLRLDGRTLRTEAIAGTAAASETAALARCEKNGREHDFVADYVASRLASLCEEVETESRQVIALRDVAHLATRFSGILAPGVPLAQVVAALHPTPAVCGTPPAVALSRLRRTEPGRGWYTGLVGMVEPGRAELAVAIRSALVHRKKLTAFAGAGIVAGSEPAAEWSELEAKIRPFLDLFTGA